MYSIINIYSVNVGGYSQFTYSRVDIELIFGEIIKNTLNKPFIICLQEVTDAQIDIVRNKRKIPYDSLSAMQANPSKDENGKKYYSHNVVIISDDFVFTGNQVPTDFFNGGRSTSWLEIKHKESESIFEICSLHGKVGSPITELSVIMTELLNNKSRILCGDFNVNSAKLLGYARDNIGAVSKYIQKMDKTLWLGKGPDFIFADGKYLEIVNFNSSIGIQANKKIPHSVIRATLQLSTAKTGGYTFSKFVRFILD